MRTHFISFSLGFFMAVALLCLFVMPKYGRDKFELGRTRGEILTKLEILDKIPSALGDDFNRQSDGYQKFIEVKADVAVIVERNGVKTLRTYR
jgi:hypothetical protein